MLGCDHLREPANLDTQILGVLFPRLNQGGITWEIDTKPAQFVSSFLVHRGNVILSDDEQQGLNLPSGAIEKDDTDPEFAIRRELSEELAVQPTILSRCGTLIVADQSHPHAVALFTGKVEDLPAKDGTQIVTLPIQDALDFFPARLENLRQELGKRFRGEENPGAHTGFGFNVNYDIKNGVLVSEIQYTDS